MKKPVRLQEPLALLFSKYGLNLDEIEEIFTGKRYSGVLLTGGNIGVCSGMGREIPVNKEEYVNIDLNNFFHRVFLNSYFNAKLNYYSGVADEGDLFRLVDFSGFRNVVMLGFIKPIVPELNQLNLRLNVFDLNRDEPELTPISEREKYLSEADAVILSSTAISNGTFLDTIKNSKAEAKIFILGPSATMAKEFFLYDKIEGIFGSVFKKRDRRIIEIIKNDEGTRVFLKYGKKKSLLKKRERS